MGRYSWLLLGVSLTACNGSDVKDEPPGVDVLGYGAHDASALRVEVVADLTMASTALWTWNSIRKLMGNYGL